MLRVRVVSIRVGAKSLDARAVCSGDLGAGFHDVWLVGSFCDGDAFRLETGCEGAGGSFVEWCWGEEERVMGRWDDGSGCVGLLGDE